MATRTALITGASRGLGLALAKRLAQDGWELVIDARGNDALETAAAELHGRGEGSIVAVVGDVTDPKHRKALADSAKSLGGLDLVVNNASALGPSPLPHLLDYPLDALEEVFRANVIAPLGVLQAVRPHLKTGAKIINITSDAGKEAYEGWGGYGASKAALEQVSAVLAEENEDLTVYWVDPGDMNTQMNQDAYPGEDITEKAMPDESVPGLMLLIDGDLPGGRYRAQEMSEEPESS